MTREVNKTVTTDESGRKVITKTIHKDKPNKTVDKEVQRVVGGAAGGSSKTKTKTINKK